MPRAAREKSKSGIYHIMLRGINRQQIFEDEQDNLKFIDILRDYKTISGYKVFAYCLMGNHIHLLMKFEDEPIEQAMKRIIGRFAYWYNVKYRRTGHLFQDRFKSEPVDDEAYFLSCIRYIHQNPVKAKIGAINKYLYSSYNAYICDDGDDLIDADFLFNLISREQYVDFNAQIVNVPVADISEKTVVRITDDEAKKIIYRTTKCKNISEFQSLDNKLKPKFLCKLKESGLGVRQISRLTGESYYIVQKS